MTRILWVWEDTPPEVWPAGYDQVLVKAFDGRAMISVGSFAWGSNYRAWANKYGVHRVKAWGVPYPNDGAELAAAVAQAVDGASEIVFDVEDFNGAVWSQAAIGPVVEGFRRLYPGVQLGYSTYPTRKQCLDHNIDQAYLDQVCDVAYPQVYYDYQAVQLAAVWNDHKHPVVTVSPADYPNWDLTAMNAEHVSGAVAFWRLGVDGWQVWGDEMPGMQPPQPAPAPAGDPMRPDTWQAFPPERFVAWDGHYWWVTDCIWSRSATQADAEGLHRLGLQVRWWPSCRTETVAAKE